MSDVFPSTGSLCSSSFDPNDQEYGGQATSLISQGNEGIYFSVILEGAGGV